MLGSVVHLISVLLLSTIWYEMQVRDWPMTTQPVEATIWQVGSGEGIRKVLSELNLGKEVTVSGRGGFRSSGKVSKAVYAGVKPWNQTCHPGIRAY